AVGLAVIDVADRQRAGGGCGVILAEAAGGGAADRGRIVGAVDGDGDQLRGGPVGAGDGEAVGGCGTGGEVLHGGVVHRVGPVAIGVEAVAAQRGVAAGDLAVGLAV